MHKRLAAIVVAASFALASGVASAESIPSGYDVETRNELAPGLEHLTLEGRDPATVVNVARLDRAAGLALRPVVSGDQVGSDLERTSSMCVRVNCLVAVNADFGLQALDIPVGGVVIDGVVLKSPVDTHHQLSIGDDGAVTTGPVRLSARLVTTDLATVDLSGVNQERGENQIVLYTPAQGRASPANAYGAELVLRVVEPGSPLRLDHTALVEIIEMRDGLEGAPLEDGTVVLSGHGTGAETLRRIWAGGAQGEISRRALLRLEATPGAAQSVGGTPILVHQGQRWFANDPGNFVRGRHPRTIVGWNDEEVFLVTVDGRQPGTSEGMSLDEAATLMLSMGATEALNLDGGGSTTFVVKGEVTNRPSDRLIRRDGEEKVVPVARKGDRVLGAVERPVTTALAIVPSNPAPPLADPLAGSGIDLPPTTSLPAPRDVDPASNPGAALPALVGATADPSPRISVLALPLAAVALAALAVAAVAVALALSHPLSSTRRKRRT